MDNSINTTIAVIAVVNDDYLYYLYGGTHFHFLPSYAV